MGAVAPSGTVTFLFTDIEGSTRLWQDDPEAMGDAVRRHDALMADAIEARHGYVFNTAGDSFAVAFGRAGDAVAAAVEAQRRLGEEPWPGPVIRVRMGLHTGEVEERDGDYFGTAANTGARVCAAGHGGQILFTTAVDEIVDTERVELGRHRLRDIARPLSLYQAEAGGLETEFPPVRSLETVRARRRRWLMPAAAVVFVLTAVAVGLVVAAGSDRDGDRADQGRQATATTQPPPTPELVDTVEVGLKPTDIAEVANDGSIWVTNTDDGTVSRINPATNQVIQTVSVGPRPGGVRAGVRGPLYVETNGCVIMEVGTGVEPPETLVDLDLGGGGCFLALGEGSLWVSDTQAGDLYRVDPFTGDVLAQIPVGASSGAVAAGEGAAWVHGGYGVPGLVRVDSDTNEVTATIPLGGGHPVIGHGSVWFFDFAEGTVSRIDPETNEVVAEIPSVARGSFGSHASEDAIWVTSTVDDTVSRIDPLTNEVTTTIDVEDDPSGVLVADGALWITNRQGGRVERYEPPS